MSNETVIPTPASPDVATGKVLIDGSEISGEFHILSISIRKELNKIPAATIVLADGDAAQATFLASNSDFFIPGKKVEIQLGYRAEDEKVFEGVIIKHRIKIRKNGSSLQIDCRDKAFVMTEGCKYAYFTEKKDQEIIEEIIDAHSLDKDIAATTPDLKEVVQYNSTDWDFILCRAEANGHVVIVNDGKVSTADPDSGADPEVTVLYGATVLELDAEIDSRRQSSAIKAKSWNSTDQEIIEVEASDPGEEGSGNLSPGELADAAGGETIQVGHGGKLSEPELQAWADARLKKERFSKIRGRVKFQGIAAPLPGKTIEVSGIGERFEGKMYVSGVRHLFTGGNWESDVEFGLSDELYADLYNLRPMPASGLLPAVSGLQAGIVTVLEGDPDGEDRIKVRLPMISDSEEGIWARLATLDAGEERGTFFRPEINDEVVVGFFNDDPRHPVVLGQLHSSAKPAPETAADDNHIKGYVSREKMKFTFDDENKVITLETPNGNKAILSEEDKGITFEDENGNKIVMNDSGIEIESCKDIIIKASGDISAEGTNIDAAAQSSLTLEGTTSAEMSGTNVSVKGSATTVIEGGIVQIN